MYRLICKQLNTQSNDYTINDTDTDNDVDDSEVVYNNRMETSSFLPHCNNDNLETNATYRELRCPRINWPSIKNEPLNESRLPPPYSEQRDADNDVIAHEQHVNSTCT